MDYLAWISTLTPLDIVILALACWRLAFFIGRENGPFDVAKRLRERYPLGGLLTCVRCASFWTALIMLILYATPLRAVVVVFAVSGLALMLASYTGAGVSGD